MGERLRHLPVEFAVGGVIFVFAVAAGWLAAGSAGGLGGALGVVLVLASYTASTIAIAWADQINPRLVFPVGMGMYVTKFSLFGAMVIAVGASDWAGKIAMAMGIVAAVVGWTGVQIWWTVRTAHPYVT